MTHRQSNLLALIITFSLVFYISWLTPIHSDDFSYYNLGLSLSKHLAHYNSWSGRFVADYIGSIILASNSKEIKAGLTAVALIGTIQIISRIPSIWFSENIQSKGFYFLFFLYWSGCLAIGQTVFWVTGAANYLFPIFFVFLYLFLLSLYIKKPENNWKYLAPMCFSGFMAGCSNESTGWAVVLLSFSAAFYLQRQRKDWAIWLPSILTLAGFMVLFLSPGNAARAANPAFSDFYTQPFISRLVQFTFFTGIPKIIMKLLPFILMATVLLVASKKAAIEKPTRSATLLFMACALLSACSMVMAPTLPTRSLSGAMFFSLLACSFAYSSLITSRNPKAVKIRIAAAGAVLTFFVLSYSTMVFSYQRAALQEPVREAVLRQEKNHGNQTASIPTFFYPPSLRRDDGLDPYHNNEAIGIYYGFKEVLPIQVDYDYSVLLDGEKYKPSPTCTETTCFFQTISLGRASLRGGTTAVFSANIETPSNLTPSENHIIFTATLKNGKTEIIEVPLSLAPAPEGWMQGLRLSSSRKNIEKISYAIIDSEKNEILQGTFHINPDQKTN